MPRPLNHDANMLAVQRQESDNISLSDLTDVDQGSRHLAGNTCDALSKAAEGPRSAANHSHSIVAGGLDETSYVTRLMPRTSLMMRLDTRFSKP